VGHHQVETRISEKTHILRCGHQESSLNLIMAHPQKGRNM
jgi:hypothetical protein